MEGQKIGRFKTTKQIERVDESKLEYVKSKFTNMDKKIRGFIMGEITVVSGLNGSGKSNWLLQEMLNFALQGYKTLLFSGEMSDYIIKNTLMRMVAGKKNLKASEEEIYYYINNEKLRTKIEEWLENKFCLYNNDCSMKGKDLIVAIKDITKRGIKVVILDNLMTIDLREYSTEKYEAQSLFVKELAMLSKKENIHIFVVVHPRKTMGFLRKEDISGTADLSNAVDNVLIMHRNNMDFRKRTVETFGNILEQMGLYKCDNIIEICKNRQYGVQDSFIGMYYEKETKKFLNQKDEHCGVLFDEEDTLPF